jgi:hypothetical protein
MGEVLLPSGSSSALDEVLTVTVSPTLHQSVASILSVTHARMSLTVTVRRTLHQSVASAHPAPLHRTPSAPPHYAKPRSIAYRQAHPPQVLDFADHVRIALANTRTLVAHSETDALDEVLTAAVPRKHSHSCGAQ